MHNHIIGSASRRDFIKTSAVAATAALTQLSVSQSAHGAGSGQIRIGLIGCGGRGTAAAVNALNAGPDIVLVSMADLFSDQLEKSLEAIKAAKPAQVQVKPEQQFVGFDAYQQLIPTVDVVLITASSVFHPRIFRAVVDAGKHVFCEKPHGIDVPGVHDFLAACEEAKRKNLNFVSGLCWRYDLGMRETVQRIHEGAIGQVLAIQENYLSRPYVMRERQPGWSEMEYQLRNWYHFNYLSGDQTAQQLVHSLDKASWVMGDIPPAKVWGMGGRQACVEGKYGDQYDHHAVVFDYANGAKVFGYTRDIPDCYSDTNDYIIGSKGRAKLIGGVIEGETNWQYKGPKITMYDLEHKALFEAIRSGKRIDNSNYCGLSTLLGVAAQIACYSGQSLAWDDIMKSKRRLLPEGLSFKSDPPIKPDANGIYPSPVPGKKQLAEWQI